MRKDYIMDISMMGLDGCPRLYENTHPCITSRLYKDPTMIISIERVDMNVEQNTIPKRREEKRREDGICIIGCMDNTIDNTFESANRVYDANGIAPTVNTCGGGGLQPKIVEVQKLNNTKFVYGREADIERLSDAVKDEEQHLCKLNKMPQGELSSLDDAEVCDIDAPVASTVTTRYYKGIGAHKDNMVLQAQKVDAQSLRMVRTEEGKALRKAYENGEIHHGFNEHRTAEPRNDDVSNTITTVQKDNLILETKQLGHIEKGTGKHQSNIVYDSDGLSPCICAGMGVKQQPTMTIEQQIVAMRGRNPENPSDRTPGAHLEQRLEPNEQGICNCLTSVSKDNMVLEKKSIKIRQATKDGFIDCEIGGVADLDYPSSETRRGRVINKGQISPTLTTENIPSVIELGNPDFYNFLYEIDGDIYLIRIRKLTPKECWKLMDFSDEDFEKAEAVNSNTQLYKQAGNSIVKNVLVAIMGQLFEGKEDVYRKV